ncbi:hypothetical protein DdX_17453 [Ditylenchus destructor]|uniref:Uncharacterized protein n=1 Tax=Ditylenchus destructor TaxID=166010 RepID=A0AAD4MM37_9BILA|nr:hypothetical protein DdX_17453 [Ditylenchus destructor]
MLFLQNYNQYTDELMNIRMMFRNDETTIWHFIKNSNYFVDHIDSQDERLVHKVIDNDEVSFIEVKHHFEIHLSDTPHPCVLVVKDDLSTVSVTTDSDGKVLFINYSKGQIEIYNWEENPNLRPLFLFGGSVFDIIEYSITQVDNMTKALAHKKEKFKFELF